MADINLERRRGPSPWVWIVGALALVLVIWAVVEFTGDDRVAEDTPATTPAAEQQPTWETAPQPVPGQEPYGVTDDPYEPGATEPGVEEPGTQPGTDDARTGAGTGTGGDLNPR